jgi:hypothetical protein
MIARGLPMTEDSRRYEQGAEAARERHQRAG